MEGNAGSSTTKAKSTRLRALVKEKWIALGHLHSRFKLVSPVPHLHLSNDAPSDEEERLIRQALEDAERRRQEIRTDTELVKSNNPVSPRDLKHIDGFICSLQGILSPVRRIPFEILQAIFLATSADPDMRTPFHKLKRKASKSRAVGAVRWPWTLSKVCRQWRQTCIGTPSLWNYLPTLHVFPSGHLKARNWENRVLASMIERSQGAPLSVYIHATGSHPSTHHTLEMLLKESNRWEELILEVTWPMYREYIQPIRNRLQQLRYLRFYFIDDVRRTDPITWDVFSDSPCLQHIDLQLFIQERLYDPPSPFSISAVQTFVSNVNLQSISLDISLNVALSSPLVLPQVKRLKLCYNRPVSPVTLATLVLPALEELIIITNMEIRLIQPNIRSLVELSTAAAKNTFLLKKLCIKTVSYPVESSFLVALIELLPNLQSLEVPLTNEGWGIVYRLACTRPGMIIAPDLEFCAFQILQVLSPSLYNALHLITKVRCGESLPADEPPFTSVRGQTGEMDLTDAVPFKRLKVLALQCQDLDVLKLHQRILEEFTLSQRSSVDPLDNFAPSTLSNLAKWFRVLEINAIGIDFRLDLDDETRRLSRETATGILEELTRCNLDDVDVKDIYIPHFHLQLQALDRYIDVNGRKVKWKGAPTVLKELQSALRETLAKCYLVLEAHINEIHWVMVNREILMYVPSDHPFRSSSESIKLARGYERTSNLSPFYEMFCEGTNLDCL